MNACQLIFSAKSIDFSDILGKTIFSEHIDFFNFCLNIMENLGDACLENSIF